MTFDTFLRDEWPKLLAAAEKGPLFTDAPPEAKKTWWHLVAYMVWSLQQQTVPEAATAADIKALRDTNECSLQEAKRRWDAGERPLADEIDFA